MRTDSTKISPAPLVSVIVPVWNGADWLDETVQSVLAQEHRPLELLLVDDGSTDGSGAKAADWAQRRPEVKLLQLAHGGVAKARNAGAEASSGGWISFLDQDDLWPVQALARHREHWRAHPETDGTMGRQHIFLQEGVPRPVWLKNEWLLSDQPGSTLGALVLRREVWERIGPFDASYSMGSDSDWLMRSREAGVHFAPLADVTLQRRIHEGNHSHDISTMRTDLIRALHLSLQRRKAAGESASLLSAEPSLETTQLGPTEPGTAT